MMDPIEWLQQQWIEHPEAFASAFRIKDKDAREVDFDVTTPQQQVIDLLEWSSHTLVVKGRQMFITTIGLVLELRYMWMFPGSTVVVGIHSDANAQLLAERSRELYYGNPMLVEFMPIANNGRDFSKHHIKFANGSQWIFTTANSQMMRSMPINFVHLTEARDYDSLGETLASIRLAPSGKMLIESTAGGEDAFFQLWNDSDPEAVNRNSFNRVFLCWRDHPEYRSTAPLPSRLLPQEIDYIRKHGLTKEEASWYIHKWRELPSSERRFMQQEMPTTADEAFLRSGDKFLLARQVPMVPVAAQKPMDERGIIRLEPYDPTCQYAAGLDPAPGSSEVGDPTGLVIINKTRRTVACTQEIREPTREHEKRTRALLREYGDPITVIETSGSGEGLGLCDSMRDMGVPMYQMATYGGLAQDMLPRHGWRTDATTRAVLFGEIYDASVGPNALKIGCQRLVGQLNALQFNKKGKPAAPKGGNDDLAVAFGLAVLGCEQALPAAQSKPAPARVMTMLEEWEQSVQARGGPAVLDSFGDACASQPGDFWD